MTSTPDLSTIASKLSEAQRAVFSRPFGILSHAFYPRDLHRACRQMGALGLLIETTDNIGNVMWRLTPLGTQLLSYLKEQAR